MQMRCGHDIVRDESKMTSRLRAELVDVIVTLKSKVGYSELILERCLGRSMNMNSVLDRLSEQRLADIQVETMSIVGKYRDKRRNRSSNINEEFSVINIEMMMVDRGFRR